MMRNSARKILRHVTSALPPRALFSIGAKMRRLRLAVSGKRSLDLACRAFDFLCCSLSPKTVSRHISCDSDSFELSLYVTDPSHYDLANGKYEAVVVEWLRHNVRAEETFWDLGANIGFYSILAARLVGPNGFVVAIEADPKIAAVLASNFEVNHVRHARVISGAITDHSGTVRLGRAPASGWTGLYYERPEEWIEVPAFTGDSLMESLQPARIHALKIDVEGAEGKVLAGMKDLLTRMKPRLLIEVHRTHAGVEQEVLKILGEFHFESEILDRADATMHIAARPIQRSGFSVGRSLERDCSDVKRH